MIHRFEKGEIDYDAFFKEGIPEGIGDAEWRAAIGRRTWKLFHGVMERYPCPSCREAGQILLSGIHDIVNLHTGKPIFDCAKWRQFLAYVHDAHTKAAKSNGHAASCAVPTVRHTSRDA